MAARVDLKPRKELINPQFDSYKLSLEPLPSYHQELEKAVDVCSLTQDQLTSHHAKLFAAPNHLTPDPWADNCVYLVDSSWTVRHVFLHQNNKVDSGRRVFDIPQAAEFRQVVGRLNTSLRFAGPQLAVLADGAGRLILLNTEDRTCRTGQWKVLLKERVMGEDVVFSVVDATSYTNIDKQDCVDCLLVSVETASEEKQRPHHLTVVTWLTLTSDGKGAWSVSRTRRLEGPRPFDYASVERGGGGGVTIASNRPYTLVSDSVKAVSPPNVAGGDWEIVGREPQHPLYTWSQTAEDLTVQLTLPADTARPDVYVSLAPDHVDIGVKNSVTLLRGSLRGRIDVAASTWTIDGQKLDLSLMKEKEGDMWDVLVPGDSRGEMTLDVATIAAIHDRLKHLTSDKWNPDPDMDNKPFNTQQLEACDAMDDDECIYLMRIDGETHSISHQATISYTLLFNVGLDCAKPPALCLRHDVDGLIWQPDAITNVEGVAVSGSCPWRHVGTLDAFGYVQASKTQRRFSSCAPDFSLAAIADCQRHVYLYRQRAPIATPLRNRRTSRDVSSVAKQHLVTVDPPEDIVGLHVSNDHVFVATRSRVLAVAVCQEG